MLRTLFLSACKYTVYIGYKNTMQHFGMRYFRDNLAEVLDRVAGGETIALTRETRRRKNDPKEPNIVAFIIPPESLQTNSKPLEAEN